MLKPLPPMDDPYVYNATLIRVIDGDTARLKFWRPFRAEWDFGFYIKEVIDTVRSIEMSCRLLGINAPEIHGASKEEIARGKVSTEELTRLLNSGKLIAQTSKPDKYGRWLADLWVIDTEGHAIHVNSYMVDNGFAVPYME
jgi:endonuclease YncB( thermonuclease family)